MEPFPGVGVFVEGGAIELGQTMPIGREVGRDPINDHSDPCLMEVIDQVHQILRGPESTGRSEVAGHLISP